VADQSTPVGKDRPLCIAVILCNDCIEDKRTNNKTLVNLFNSITAPVLPASQPRLVVMASLTNGIGRWPVSFSIRTPSGKAMMRVDGEAVFSDPLAVMDIVIAFNNLTFTEEGVYFVDVLTDSYPLGNRRFTVQVVPGAREGRPA